MKVLPEDVVCPKCGNAGTCYRPSGHTAFHTERVKYAKKLTRANKLVKLLGLDEIGERDEVEMLARFGDDTDRSNAVELLSTLEDLGHQGYYGVA